MKKGVAVYIYPCPCCRNSKGTSKILVELAVSQRLRLPGILCDLYYFACLVKNLQASRETRVLLETGQHTSRNTEKQLPDISRPSKDSQ